jgi:hypothetical protein
MKAKKAIKRLKKAQLLLTSVVKQYADSSSAMYDLLSAADGINRAKALIEADDTSSQKGANASEPRRTSASRKATPRQSLDGKKSVDGKKTADGKQDSTAAPKKRISSKSKS